MLEGEALEVMVVLAVERDADEVMLVLPEVDDRVEEVMLVVEETAPLLVERVVVLRELEVDELLEPDVLELVIPALNIFNDHAPPHTNPKFPIQATLHCESVAFVPDAPIAEPQKHWMPYSTPEYTYDGPNDRQ